MKTDIYDKAYDQWMNHALNHDEQALSDLLADDVVFHSPVVFTPQEGKFITFLYLKAAGEVLQDFHYTLEIREENNWALRFESKVGDIKVIGFDIITLNEAGKITNFEVLVRPAKAMGALQQAMAQQLEKLKG